MTDMFLSISNESTSVIFLYLVYDDLLYIYTNTVILYNQL